ncbi:MAG: S-layer homology domain-containing protein [Propionibacteriaceae bacterium]|jgi:hypothetical protein|nr:S-layer homology domain-containing protein [Propionibacteriaceae bacterium]
MNQHIGKRWGLKAGAILSFSVLGIAVLPATTAQADSVVLAFSDVSETTMYYTEISWLANQGISTGWDVPGGKEFRPLSAINRDAMAAFLYRYAGSPAYTPPAVSPFLDVTPATKYYKEMSWLADQGISTGWDVPGGKEFRPLSPINRDAMAAFLYRLAHS